MNILIRKSRPSDLQQVYELNKKCFFDHFDESRIMPYLDHGFVLEIEDSNKIIGVLLQGIIITRNPNLINTVNSNYKSNAFAPVNDAYKLFLENNIFFKKIYGIAMLCIDNNFRSKGLAKKLVETHLDWQQSQSNPNNPNNFSCLNVRVSNHNAYNLYKKLGYQDIAIIKNNYVFQDFFEDSIFMVKNLT